MKIKVLSHNYTGRSLVFVFVNKQGKVETKIVENSHVNWREVERAYRAKDFDKVFTLIDVIAAISTKSNGKFEVKNGVILYNGAPVNNNYIVDRILFFIREGLPFERLLRFAENLYANPSESSRNSLYKFLEFRNFPVTDDGCFLAYKGVQDNFYSITSGGTKLTKGKVEDGRVFNGIGEVIETERRQVDDNTHSECSYGLHVGSHQYASGFRGASGRLLIVKVNPRDVVSVPSDGAAQKIRTCRYEVIAEENGILDEKKHGNFDKVAKLRQERDGNGRFTSKLVPA
jgi:hypothetical protein